MVNKFTQIKDKESLDKLLEHSSEEPVVLFKHSTTCPVSSAAYKEMSEVEGPVSMVVVQSARDVSDEVEARTGIRHESPQAIVFRNGSAVWSASHFKITSEAVERAVRENV